MAARTVVYRRIWEEHHGRKIPKGYHVHHIDGDKSNNRPDNLHCCSPDAHWLIHYKQGDIVATKRGKFISRTITENIPDKVRGPRPNSKNRLVGGARTEQQKQAAIKESERRKGLSPWNKGKKGAQVAWNKGLTKEIDPRVAAYGITRRQRGG